MIGEGYHCRNRAQIHASGDGGLGFAKTGSHESVRTSHCPALVPIIERWLVSENRKAHPYRALSALIGDRPRFVVLARRIEYISKEETTLQRQRSLAKN